MPTSRCALAAVAALALAWLAPPARAEVTFSGNTTTVLRAFDLLQSELREGGQPIQRVVSYRPVDQLVRLSWDDAGKRGAWSFDVSLRGRTDLQSGKAGGQSDDLDVLLATARWRSAKGLVGLTIGRQNTVTSFGWHAFDGVRLDFEKAPHVRVFVNAGMPVDLFEGGSPDTSGYTWATGVTGIFPRHGSLGVDYEIRHSDGNVLSEAAGLDLDVHGKNTRFQANGDYSILLDELGEATLVLGQTIRRKHDLELRWTRVRPVFDSDSIWNAWALNPYDETRLQYEFRGDGPLDIGGYISVESYEPPDLGLDEGPPPEPQDPSDLPEDIRRAAVTLRWESKHEAIHRSEVGWQHGWSGDRLALMHDSDWGLNPRWRVGAGASMHRYENRYRLDEQDEVWSVRGRIRHDHDGKWDLALEIEQYFGRDRDTLRAALVFGTRFGKARGEFPWWGGRWNWSRPTRTSAIPQGGSKGEQ